MKYNFYFPIILFSLNACFLPKKTIQMECSLINTVDGNNRLSLDSIAQYSCFHEVPYKSMLEVNDIINYSRHFQSYNIIKDSVSLRTIDSNVIKIKDIYIYLTTDSIQCSCFNNSAQKSPITDLLVMYYRVNGHPKEIYISYSRLTNDQIIDDFNLNCNTDFYYKCAEIITLIKTLKKT